MKLKCLVVDDEDLALALLEDYIRQCPELEWVGSCEDGLQAQAMLRQQEVDLLFLDIQMPFLNGLELLESLPLQPAVVITTSYPDYALEGFRLSVVDYLLKPFLFERFAQAVRKAGEFARYQRFTKDNLLMTNTLSEHPDYLFVRSDYKMIKVKFDDILYIEGLKQYVKIQTLQKLIITLESLKNLEHQLPIAQFARVHKSFIVAVNQVEAIATRFVVIQKKKIPVGKTYRAALSYWPRK